ncbi:hypothetical protein QOZ80_6AG0521720 [Eleusine coracana subsp. coracana]|nr:hypothetical protein QOZ80_6AG0521720 [Eleusine coracana subsp. coracana]
MSTLGGLKPKGTEHLPSDRVCRQQTLIGSGQSGGGGASKRRRRRAKGNRGGGGREQAIETMHFRVLGSALARRFTPRGFPRTQAQAASSPWMVSRRAAIWATAAIPARPLHSVRDLVVADGSNGGVFMAAFAGLAGFIYLSQIYKDESAAEDTGKVTPGVGTRKEVEKMPAVEVFKDKDVDDQLSVDVEDAGVEHKETEEDDTVDEAAMTARFEEWMKKHEKTYRSMEEKAMRYENLKKTVKRAAKFNASKGTSFQPNGLADLSLEECDGIYDSTLRGDRYWEEYVALLKSIKAQMKEV